MLQDSWSIVTGLLEKVYGRGCEMLLQAKKEKIFFVVPLLNRIFAHIL